jgi:hypothetical protein
MFSPSNLANLFKYLLVPLAKIFSNKEIPGFLVKLADIHMGSWDGGSC